MTYTILGRCAKTGRLYVSTIARMNCESVNVLPASPRMIW